MIQKDNYFDFATCLEKFFSDYLIKERGASNHTIRSYRDTFVLLIDYLSKEKNIKPYNISFSHIGKECILEFLDWLECKRGCSTGTRNQRCAALRSFFRYMMYIDPAHMSQWKNICEIRLKRYVKGSLAYLSVEALKCLLDYVPVDTRKGRRDMAVLTLMYQTGARVQEIIDMTPSSIRLSKPFTVELLGKGSKKRIVPIDENSIELVNCYIKENNLDDCSKRVFPLFFNCWGERLSTAGVSYILEKYYLMAKKEHEDLFPDKISPHVLRHSKAMHLLQSGVNLVYIRDILGHASIKTTEIYARADSKYKREALEKAYIDVSGVPTECEWEKDDKLKQFLKGLA